MEQNFCRKYHDGGLKTDLVKCTLCNVVCNTMEQFNIHILGKSHIKKLKSESFINLGNNFTCVICNMNMNCQEQYDAHCNGAKHKKKISSSNYPSSSSVTRPDPCNTGINENDIESHNNGNIKIENVLTVEMIEEIENAFQEDCVISEKAGFYEKLLLFASKEGQLNLAELSVKKKCDIEICDEKNRRPIHYACLTGYHEIVKLLIDVNCDFQALDKDNKSPLDLAKQNNHQGIIEILKSAKCDLILKKQIASMGLICSEDCDHKFCSTSLSAKTFSKGEIIRRINSIELYRCKASLIGREFAIKCIPVNAIEKNNKRNIEENVNHYLEVLQHVRIVQYFGAIETDMHLCIFMDFLPRGSLDDEIKRNSISTENVIKYSCQISEGLSYLHGKKIIHRDIKPGNILLDEFDNIKLVDFGISRLLIRTDGHSTNTTTFCGTPNFMAPEVIHGEKYTVSADIWSLGATIINMISGNPPYHWLIKEAVIFKIGTNKTLELPTENISDPMKILIKQMTNEIPESRPRASDLINQKLYK